MRLCPSQYKFPIQQHQMAFQTDQTHHYVALQKLYQKWFAGKRPWVCQVIPCWIGIMGFRWFPKCPNNAKRHPSWQAGRPLSWTWDVLRCYSHKMSQVDLWIWDDLGHGHGSKWEDFRPYRHWNAETSSVTRIKCSSPDIFTFSHMSQNWVQEKNVQETLYDWYVTGKSMVSCSFSVFFPWTNPLNMLAIIIYKFWSCFRLPHVCTKASCGFRDLNSTVRVVWSFSWKCLRHGTGHKIPCFQPPGTIRNRQYDGLSQCQHQSPMMSSTLGHSQIGTNEPFEISRTKFVCGEFVLPCTALSLSLSVAELDGEFLSQWPY